ncbi:MurR/RpiR family transcriptional regulator [Niallia circulans]|uniref:MurR/RpiR family transcriptional regulator n=1 Tax=Niallia circulans TaxID=1397 RepID=UPI000F45C482|nr:MurR/RpiR family transcriptional regulator [Niallia circulans]AYV67961.1 MurR/RpiR family transcriptional regulator [Niallia circulans]UQZ75983.1 MurR/RpiR family transcriptional regulator [Niallia circulans]
MLKDLMNKYYDQLSENDLYVINYVLNHIEECKKMSILELSEACTISKSSILRMTQKIGFSGYSEFKYFLKNEPKSFEPNLDFFTMQMKEIEMTRKLYKNIDTEAIYNQIRNADTIYGFASGWGQRNALEEMARQFISNNKKIYIIPAETEFDFLLAKMKPTDLVIVISLSGDVKNIVGQLRQLAVKSIPTLSITSFNNNHLATLSTYNIYYESFMLGKHYEIEHRSLLGLFTVIDSVYRGYLDYSVRKNESKD